MPVVTRSCGRKEPRRRIEDSTPARICKTTAKRRKDVSDEENERPPKKKPSISDKSQAATTTLCNKKYQGLKKSRIPQRCVSEKIPVKNIRIYENADEDDNEVQFKADKMKNTESPEARDGQCTAQETPFRSPVASRTRSYSALKRSYKRKKPNQADKKHGMQTSLGSTSGDNGGDKTAEGDSLKENEKESDVEFQVKEADSSTCNEGNERMEVTEDGCVSSGGEGRNEEYYKNRFHEMVQKLKQMQEQFSQAHQNTHKNITAYDAFIKELKASLEQEKRKNATIEEELNQTREQLLMAQKEKNGKLNEQQDKSMSTTCTSQGSSQNEEFSQLEDLEKAENSALLGIIKFYAGLTGITLSSDSPTSNSELIESYCCAYRPKATGQVMQFRLTHDKEFEEYEYSPNFQSPKNGTFLRKIPGYLKENIYFNTDQAQSFLVSLIKAVQKV